MRYLTFGSAPGCDRRIDTGRASLRPLLGEEVKGVSIESGVHSNEGVVFLVKVVTFAVFLMDGTRQANFIGLVCLIGICRILSAAGAGRCCCSFALVVSNSID